MKDKTAKQALRERPVQPTVRLAELEDYLERINDILWRVYTVNKGMIPVHEKEIMDILEEWAQNN